MMGQREGARIFKTHLRCVWQPQRCSSFKEKVWAEASSKAQAAQPALAELMEGRPGRGRAFPPYRRGEHGRSGRRRMCRKVEAPGGQGPQVRL